MLDCAGSGCSPPVFRQGASGAPPRAAGQARRQTRSGRHRRRRSFCAAATGPTGRSAWTIIGPPLTQQRNKPDGVDAPSRRRLSRRERAGGLRGCGQDGGSGKGTWSTRRDRENQPCAACARARKSDLDPIRASPYRPAAQPCRMMRPDTRKHLTACPTHQRKCLHQRGRPHTAMTSCCDAPSDTNVRRCP